MSTVDARLDWSGTLHERAPSSPRIACLVPSITELLFALDLGAHVIARTGFCVHPHDAVRKVPKIGGTKDPDLERLAALAPTHLIVNIDENRREVVDAARAFVPNIVVTHPQRLADNPRLYRLIGAVFDREYLAGVLCDAFDAAREALVQAVRPLPRERVLYLVWKKPWMTVSRETYIADALGATRWDALIPDGTTARYPPVSDDDPVWDRADRILLSTEPYAFVRREAEAIERARKKPVHLVDGEMTSWYGPRAIAGMGYLAAVRREITAAAGQVP